MIALTKNRPSLLRYGAALAAVACAVGLRYLFDPILGERQPFVTLYAAIAFAIWYSRLRATVIAAILGGILAQYLFVEPRNAIRFDSLSDYVAILAYSSTAAVIIFFGELASRTARKSNEDRLRLEIAQQAAQAGAFEWRINSRSANWSDDLRAIFGVDPQYPSTREGWEALLHPEDRDTAIRNIDQVNRGEMSVYDNTYRIITPAGKVKHILARGRVLFNSNGAPDRVVGLNVDMTAYRELEEALLHSEKLAAAGRMAATVAHEINNPLQAVLGHLFLLRQDPSLSRSAKQILRSAEDDMRRVASLAQRSLGFFRASSAAKAVAIPEIIKEVVEVYRMEAQTKNVDLELSIEGGCVASGNSNDLKQVLSNLVLNALNAMPTGGNLTISSRIEGEWIKLTVQDNGAGIPSEYLPRVFDAFFTTRQGVGTGLGLWLSKSIVESMGGKICIQSETASGKHGTQVTILLPVQSTYTTRVT